jgi:hypothetical protein
VDYFGPRIASHMVWTVPFIVVGMGRFLWLTTHRPKAESPTEEMLRDPLFMATLAAWVLAVIAVIYIVQ